MRAAFLSFLNADIKPPLVAYRFNKPIEQYRGVCAILVMMAHGFVYTNLLTNNFHWPEFMNYLGAGYLSVLVFFCISGYVIGINYSNKVLNLNAYIKNRLVRLYPIYLISILLSIAVVGSFTAYELISNLLFLQNDTPYINFQIPMLGNFVTWSLNFEVLYYTLFIGIFFLQPKTWKLLACLLILSILTMYSSVGWHFLGNYINGFYFWILGLLLAWDLIKNGNKRIIPVPFLSLVFLQMCQHYLGIGEIVLHILHIYTTNNFNWLFDIPFCLMVMCFLTAKDNAFLRINKIICYVTPGVIFLFLIINHRLFENIRWIMCIVYWLLSLLFYFERRLSGFLMEKFTGIGKISYSIYLFHVPVAYLIKKVVFIDSRPVEVTVKYTLWIAATLLLSVLTETKLQPRIKRYFA